MTPESALTAALAAVLAAVGRGDHEAALVAALEAWCAHPVAAIADLIEAIDDAFVTERDAVTALGTIDESFEAREANGQARDVRPLIRYVLKRSETYPAASSLLPTLAERRGRDPRIAAALIHLHRNPPYARGASGLYDRIYRALVAIGDRRDVAEIIELSEAYRGTRRAVRFLGRRGMPHLHRAADELRALASPLEIAGTDERCRAIEATLAQRAPAGDEPDIAAMLDEVLAAPDDLSRRQVYADVLIERGDPRGEFIALQCGRLATGASASTRERQLQKTHQRRWLGELEPVVLRGGLEWRGGFLHGLRYRNRQRRQSVVGSPQWITVAKLDVESWGFDVADVLLDPVMRSLRRVTGIGYRDLERVVAHDSEMPWVHLRPEVSLENALPVLAPIGSLVALTALDLSSDPSEPDAIAGLLESPLGQRLETLRLRAVAGRMWRRIFSRLKQASPQLRRVELVERVDDSRPVGWLVGFERSSTGAFDRLTADHGRKSHGRLHERLLKGLRCLSPTSLGSVHVRAAAQARAKDPDYESGLAEIRARFNEASFDFDP